LLGEGNTTLIAAPEGNVAHYLSSLCKIEALGADRLYPAHGPRISEVRARIEVYRQHRLRRIEEVRAALEALPSASIEALVMHIYGEQLDPSLRTAAGAAVEAMVQYVQRDN
jgi:glyoxylase-like metal-dependent hydrolase (beta-lactamase superfamily II)